MGQIFHRSTNSLARLSIIGTVVVVGGLLWFFAEMQRSPYYMGQGVAPAQPVPFSHQHHVGGLGIDCRYCHTSVEVSGFAGIPPTKTCMNCHARIWTNAGGGLRSAHKGLPSATAASRFSTISLRGGNPSPA